MVNRLPGSRTTLAAFAGAAVLLIMSAQPGAAETGGTPATEQILDTGRDQAARMTVDVLINSQGPFKFLVDTGADRSVVSKDLADRLGLPSGGAARLLSISGIDRVETATIEHMDVGSRRIASINAPVLEEAHLGTSGILGIDALANQHVVMDFKSDRMTIGSSAAKPPAERAEDRDAIVVRARRRHGQLILVDASIDGERVDMIIDSGAQYSIGNSALLRRLGARATVKAPTTLVSVTGDEIPAGFATVPEMKIGGVRVRDASVVFADVHPFKRFGLLRRPAMLLGMDLLKSFERVSVDFANRKVRFLLADSR